MKSIVTKSRLQENQTDSFSQIICSLSMDLQQPENLTDYIKLTPPLLETEQFTFTMRQKLIFAGVAINDAITRKSHRDFRAIVADVFS